VWSTAGFPIFEMYIMHQLLQQLGLETAWTMVRYFLIAGTAFLVFYWMLAPKLGASKIQQRKARRSDFFREIMHSSSSSVMLAAMAILALSDAVRPYTFVYTEMSDYPLWWFGLSVALALVVHDTYFYWMHRVLHHPKMFRLTHLVHHKSTNPSPFTAYSFHILEAIAEGGVVPVLVFAMPMHPAAISLFALSSLVINVYGHLGYEIMPKFFRRTWLFEILNTSTFHNFHHLKFRGNYGLYFRVWDRWMGTEHPDYIGEYDRIQARRFGPSRI